MQANRRMFIVVGALVSSFAGAGAAAVGCGGNESGTGPNDDGGLPDSTSEQDVVTPPDSPSGDVVVPTDSASESAAPDADAGPIETPDADAGPIETPDADAGPIGTPDADAGPIIADAGDAGEGGLNINSFPGLVASALCNRLENCCPAPAAGQIFNMNSCISLDLSFGYAGSSEGQSFISGGHVAFDATKAQSCLSQIAAIDCTANLLTSAQQQSILAACYGALSGTQQIGQPCSDAIECAPGAFCEPQDGGGSVCAALRTTGQPCSDFGASGYGESDTACSYRGSGNTGLTCQNSNFSNYTTIPLDQWVCIAAQSQGAGCFVNVDCSSQICDPGANFTVNKCANSEPFAYPAACSGYYTAAPDGGN
jgi:hypothetical protein